MPWKSLAEQEQAKLVVKEAYAEGKVGSGMQFMPFAGELIPFCSMGHLKVKGIGNQLSLYEWTIIMDANDSAASRPLATLSSIEPVLQAIDQIQVGED